MNYIKNSQLYQLILAHLKEVMREPAVLFWGIGFPILMSWGLGIAFTAKKEINREIALIQQSDSTFKKSQLFDIIEHFPDKRKGEYILPLKNPKIGNVNLTFRECTDKEAQVLMKKGITSLIVKIENGELQYHFDPANSDAQLLYQLVKEVVKNGAGYYAENQDEIKPLTVTGTRYIDFLIPGLLAMGVMMSCSWGISYTIIERRSKKLLRRMVATPMRKWNLLIALIFARFIMNVIESLLLFLFAVLYFHIQMQGNFIAFALLFISGNMAFAGISVLISSHTANPEIGNGLINALVTPMMVLSGVFFSYQHFPDWIIPFIQYLPLTMMADGFRSIFNEGAGLLDVWKEVSVLFATGLVSFVVGLKIFKWY